MKKYIIPSSIVLIIVAGVLLNVYSKTSDEQSVQPTIQAEVKTEIKAEANTNTGELTTTEILSKFTNQEEKIEPEIIETQKIGIIKKDNNQDQLLETQETHIGYEILSELDSLPDFNREKNHPIYINKIISDEVKITQEIDGIKEFNNSRTNIIEKHLQEEKIIQNKPVSAEINKEKQLSEYEILLQLEKQLPIALISTNSDEEDEEISIIQPDFQPNEYFRNSEEEAPQVYRYNPKPEWFIPDGNPEDFSMDSMQGISNADGVNIKRIYFTINRQYIETPLSTLEGMTTFLKQYIQQDFYFVGDNEEESQLRSIHVNVKSLDEANQLIKEMKQNVKISNAYNGITLLPQFKDREIEINSQVHKFSEL